MKKIFIIIATRPDVIKLAPVIKEFKNRPFPKVQVRVINTGQHREMVNELLPIFKIKVDFELGIMRHNQTLSYIATRVINEIEKLIIKERPNLIMVQGDTTSALAASLAAFHQKVEIAHVEAGLRSGNKLQPYPEEINRRIIDEIADIHFAPTVLAKKNLINEGINAKSVYVTGNTVIDSLLEISKTKNISTNKFIKNPKERIILLTVHRRENFGKPLKNICKAIKQISKSYTDSIRIICSVHLNPNVRKIVLEMLNRLSNVSLINPLKYPDFVDLMKSSYLILTDSGGINEEAAALGVPVLLLRELSDRPENVKIGIAKIVGTNTENIIRETKRLLDNKKEYKKMAEPVPLYGDGKASKRIVKIVLRHLKA